MKRQRKRKGNVLMKHYMRRLQKAHYLALKECNYYKNNE